MSRRRLTTAAVTVLAVGLVTVLVGLFMGTGKPKPKTATGAMSPSTTGTPASAAPPTPTCEPWGCAQQARFAAGTALVAGQPGYLGVVVRDRVTGATWQAGAATRQIWASSTPKLALATSLLERARAGQIRIDAAARRQMDAMLATSDDNAADALWDRYGGDTQLARFQQVYGMAHATFVSGFPRRWGFIKTTAEDLAQLMSYVLDRLNAADRAYLVQAMRGVGSIQHWGVWAAGASQQPGVKDGWSIEKDDGVKHWVTSTVGFAGPDERYIVAAMYHLLPGSGTIAAGCHALSDLVATVFGAPTPAAITVPDPSTGL